MKRPILALIVVLAGCANPPRTPTEHTVLEHRGPMVGLQVWNHGTGTADVILRVVSLQEGLPLDVTRTIHVPRARTFDASLGGDPNAQRLTGVALRRGRYRVTVSRGDDVHERDLTVDGRTWLIGWVTDAELGVATETESGPRFLE